ncbi:MAG TPA: rhodanese-like domain-containing protein [Vicinamibacteria bacterium]|nr:rhodanese-like domain-containing protein [Vicinamibacteria bacterium]
MKIRLLVVTSLVSALALPVAAKERPQMANPAIDMAGHLRVADEAARHRQTHRVSEAEFIRMSRQPGTVVLDARSREKYDELHVKGAINLSFPDISYETLNKALPDKKTRILIYCNNNFREVPAFPTKAISSALNLSTFITLYDYGYRDVYELAPLLEVGSSRLQFEGRAAAERAR